MINIAELNQDLLNELFSFNVIPWIQLVKLEEFPKKYTEEEEAKIQNLIDKKHTIVGIDIYQYSSFPANKQVFIPALFESIYVQTWNFIRENYSFIVLLPVKQQKN